MQEIPTVEQLAAKGEKPEVVFWVGCAGSYDPRAQKVSKAFVNILQNCGVSFAILGNDEQCTGDPARRAGNEFVFQMTAQMNIQTLDSYEIKNLVTACPHCFNTLKNEYPELGGNYNVVHHTQFIEKLIEDGRLKIAKAEQKKKVTYHDSCYIGRVNGVYEVPRNILKQMNIELKEMKRCGSKGLCCGAGGSQMFKEDEPGDKRINIERVEEAIDTGAETIAVNCPFCLTMMSDGVKAKEKQEAIMVLDLAEMIVENQKWES